MYKLVYPLTIFVGAFLLFQVQPMLAKYIFPWFGSAPAVWTTCMLFFQMLLLGGYAYAHFLSDRLPIRAQLILHLALLGVALALLPITPSKGLVPEGGANPTRAILAMLAFSVGGPYFLLASTGPLLQRWYSLLHRQGAPYRLYAVSNAGSLLALLSYPFLFEPYLRLETQTLAWAWSFGLFALLQGLSVWPLFRTHDPSATAAFDAAPGAVGARPGLGLFLLWIVLAALPSVAFLATTNRMTQYIPPLPFLWVLPLGIYLLSFILCFENPRWYSRRVFCIALPLTLVGVCGVLQRQVLLPIEAQVVFYCGALFVCCMICHGELYRLRPDPRHLTLFYLMLSMGGALGGGFVALVAPWIFTDLWEYELSLVGISALAIALIAYANRELWHGQRSRFALPLGAALIGFACFVGFLGWSLGANTGGSLLMQSRNFYGVLRVTESSRNDENLHKYNLYHGWVRHGFQYTSRRSKKTSYYGEKSGVGLAINSHPARGIPDRQFRIGVVGLGTGVISAYANERGYLRTYRKTVSDYLGYYEINPAVVSVAGRYFTFTQDASARGAYVDVFTGDARIVLQGQLDNGQAQGFDVLVIDAFNGDTVPAHLLTRECFAIYLQHLGEGGILAFHVSTRFLDLKQVIGPLADHFEVPALHAPYLGDEYGSSSSDWVLVTRNPDFLQGHAQLRRLTAADSDVPLWTDDFSSVFGLLR